MMYCDISEPGQSCSRYAFRPNNKKVRRNKGVLLESGHCMFDVAMLKGVRLLRAFWCSRLSCATVCYRVLLCAHQHMCLLILSLTFTFNSQHQKHSCSRHAVSQFCSTAHQHPDVHATHTHTAACEYHKDLPFLALRIEQSHTGKIRWLCGWRLSQLMSSCVMWEKTSLVGNSC